MLPESLLQKLLIKLYRGGKTALANQIIKHQRWFHLRLLLLLLLLLMIWQSPGLPGWRKVNFINVTRRPHHPNIAAGLYTRYCLATSPGFLPTLCEKWSGFFYVHRVLLSYTRDRRLKVSSERLGNVDKAPCPRALLPGPGLEPGTSSMEVRGSNCSATIAPRMNNGMNQCPKPSCVPSS